MKIRLGALIIPAVLITLGVALGKFGLKQVEQGLTSESWLEAEAKVEEFGFHKSSGSGSNRKGRGGNGTAPAVIFIKYTYEVGGETYEGDNAGYGAMTGGDMPRRPHKGAIITIKYNPDNIGESVWIAGVAKSAKIASICGLVLVLLGVFVLVISFRGKRGR